MEEFFNNAGFVARKPGQRYDANVFAISDVCTVASLAAQGATVTELGRAPGKHIDDEGFMYAALAVTLADGKRVPCAARVEGDDHYWNIVQVFNYKIA